MNQLDLFDESPEPEPERPAPYVRGSETSKAAADSICKHRASLQIRVLTFLTERGDYGATDEEQQIALDMKGNTQRPRRRRLQQRGLIEKADKRPTQSGRMATVWRVTEEGREETNE